MGRTANTLVGIAALASLGGAGAVLVGGTAGARGGGAKAVLRAADGSVVGEVKFSTDGGHTQVKVHLVAGTGAVDAFHGFHIHANADGAGCIAPAFTSVGGHWNPSASAHGGHTGDLPSVYVNVDGSAETRFTIDRVSLADLAGRAVVLHAGRDNFGNVPVGTNADQYTDNGTALAATNGTGNAGARIACGVITA